MAVVNFNYPKFKYTIPSTGEPGAGYKLFTYEEGTSTKKTTWTSLAKTAENTNPVILDANGECDVWIDGNYKFVLAPPTDTDPPTSAIWSYDAIRSPIDPTSAEVTSNISPVNGSFETDTDVDTVPDNWTVIAYTGGSVAIDSTTSTHGTNSLKFTSAGAGGGMASTDEYYEVEAGEPVGVRFSIISANADTHNKVEVYWYDSSKVYLSTGTSYDEAAANPTSWTRKLTVVTAPATAKYARIVLTGVAVDSTTHSTTNFDNIELDKGFLGGLTSTYTELNVLDGITSNTAELNYLDLTTGPGTQEASKAVVADANVNTGISKVTQLHIGASGSEVQVTATPTELNYSVGVTSSIQTQLNTLNTTSSVLSLIAGASVGAVGTYAMMMRVSSLATNNPGDTIAGSDLRYSGLQADGSSGVGGGSATSAGYYSGVVPSGTWRCMGYSNYGGTSATQPVTVWLRIA